MGVDHDPEQAGTFRIPMDDGNRATVAMVLRAVDDMKALTQAHFENVHTRLDGLAGLPDELHAIKERQLLTEARLTVIEGSAAMQQTVAERKRAYRSGTLPLIVVAVVGTVINAALYLAPH